jgi:probable rRNA maturation factor
MFNKKLLIKFSATKEFEEVNYDLKHIVRCAISETLGEEDFSFPAEISVTFCDNAYIKEINKKYRNKNSATDVLSFPMYDYPEDEGELFPGDEALSLGDIVISVERAKKQAEEIGNSFEREVAFLCVHSVLHLLGYDHELGPDEEKEMFAKQEDILKIMHLGR